MKANGLVVNPGKTAFVLLNVKQDSEKKQQVKIGDVQIENQSNAKLLGMKFEDSMTWKEHIHGKGGILNSLNQRLFLLRRLNNQLNKKAMTKVADSIFNSKIRYGLQLMGKVRIQEEDGGLQTDLKALQLMQNKMVRMVNHVKLSDKQTTSSLLKRINMISVNQINAQIKITEIWKAVNNDECPLKITKMMDVKPERRLRSKNEIENNLLESGLTENSKKTFINDGIRLWNRCPSAIKQSKSLFTVKKEIKKFVVTLPI